MNKYFKDILNNSQFTMISGKTNSGKTRFLMWLAALCSENNKVLYISTEMSERHVINNFSPLLNVDLHKKWIRTARKLKMDRIKGNIEYKNIPGIVIKHTQYVDDIKKLVGDYDVVVIDSILI